ncbi:MAG: hypothetical protein NZT61_07925, partial [Deltaproteobacteria bacterium]|nr:hypothetical protein [Deltaproteobacteria bacterium]
ISGISRIKVSLSQGQNTFSLFDIQLNGEKYHKFNIVVDDDILNELSDGIVSFQIFAQDDSNNRNSVKTKYQLILDNSLPSVNFISYPENVNANEAFLCIYEIQDNNLGEVFLRDGFNKYSVFRGFDYDENLGEKLYLSLHHGTEYITITDKAGNILETRCPSKIIEGKLTQKVVEKDWFDDFFTEVSKSVKELSRFYGKRLFDDLGLRFRGLSFNETIQVSGQESIDRGVKETILKNNVWFFGLKPTTLYCTFNFRIEKIKTIADKTVVFADIGLGVKIVLVGLGQVYLKEGKTCAPEVVLGQTGEEFGVFTFLRDAVVDPLSFFDTKTFINNFVRVSAVAKQKLGGIPLSPIESAAIKR